MGDVFERGCGQEEGNKRVLNGVLEALLLLALLPCFRPGDVDALYVAGMCRPAFTGRDKVNKGQEEAVLHMSATTAVFSEVLCACASAADAECMCALAGQQ